MISDCDAVDPPEDDVEPVELDDDDSMRTDENPAYSNLRE